MRRALAAPRAKSLARLRPASEREILLAGVGTGLDLPHLPSGPRYVGLDFARPMLARAVQRRGTLDIGFVEGDAQRLPFADASFDAVILHLIVAVVAHPARCLAEAARVLRPRGRVLLLDKFLRPQERAWLRRALNPLVSRFATRMNVVLENALTGVPLTVLDDRPALLGGWFRLVELERR